MALTTHDDPLGSEMYGTGTFYRPCDGLVAFVFVDCGIDLERQGPSLADALVLKMAGRIIDMLRDMVEDSVLVTDFRLSNIVCKPQPESSTECPRLIFVDTASIATGQARPASSFAILAVHFRSQVRRLSPLLAAMRDFTAEHCTRERITSVKMPVGEAIALSVKISIAQLLRFSEVRPP